MKSATQHLRTKYNKIAQKKNYLWIFSLVLLVLVFLITGTAAAIYGYYQDRMFSNVAIADYDVSSMKTNQALQATDQLSSDYISQQVLKIAPPKEASKSSNVDHILKLEELELSYDNKSTVNQAYKTHRGETLQEFFYSLLFTRPQQTTISYQTHYNEKKLQEFLQPILDEYEKPGAKPEIQIVSEAPLNFEVFPGTDGYAVDYDDLVSQIEALFSSLDSNEIQLELVYKDNQLSNEQLEIAKQRATVLAKKSLTMEIYPEDESNNQTWSLDNKQLVSFIDPNGGFDTEQISLYVDTLSESIDRAPQNAAFDFQNGEVTNFVPSKPGLGFPSKANTQLIISKLTELENSSTDTSLVESSSTLVLQVKETEPEITTADVNDLGIKELIGVGKSTFKGSIASRVHNVTITAERINGTLVAPGEEFSFNKAVGEISRATGYQTAYVISGGRTVLGDGGGVCQDSTTVFRAILDAGLPITQWKAHSYRVGYYEQNERPGFDATIYQPSVDLKFLNDTPGHILIQAIVDVPNRTLEVRFYGTDDGRVSEVSNYQQWDAIPAPPPLYQDDPTLAPGQIKQIDWATPGLKVSYDYTVTRDGETIYEKSFYANFRAWQAVYLRGI